MTPSYRRPGRPGEEEALPFWPLLLVSLLLHAVVFWGFSTRGFDASPRLLARPVTMVELGGAGLRGPAPEAPGPGAEQKGTGEAPPPAPPEPRPAKPAPKAKPVPKTEPERVKMPAKREPTPVKPKAPPKREPPPPPTRSKPEPAPPKSAVKLPTKSTPPAPERPAPAPKPPKEAPSPEDHVAERIAKLREKNAASPEDLVAEKIAKMREKRSETAAEADVADRVARIREKQIQGSEAQVARRVEALREKYGTREPGKGGGRPEGGGGASPLAIQGSAGGGALGLMEANYLRSVKEHLDLRWSVPEPLKGKGYRASVTVFVDRSGAITDWAIQRSGNTLFDERVKRAVTEANPLPPVPPGLPGQRFEYELRFSAP